MLPSFATYILKKSQIEKAGPAVYMFLAIQRTANFTYLGVPFNQAGYIDRPTLIEHNMQATISAMDVMAFIGARAHCPGKLLCTRLHRQFLRPNMKYGLTIALFIKKEYNTLQETQNTCLRKIYDIKTNQAMTIVHHISNLAYMKDRLTTLQAKFLLPS